MYLLFVPYTDLYAAEGISAFQTSFLFIFLVAVNQLVILSDRTMHLMTSNPDYLPLGDIIQGHFHKSFELLIKFALWLWLTVNVVCGPQMRASLLC